MYVLGMGSSLSPLRVGVIGVGTMGKHHARICAGSPDVILAGIFDTDEERAREVSQQYDCASFSSVDELVDQVDAVTIASPTSTHSALGAHCLERGLHVLVEKPLAHTVQDAELLVNLAREQGATLMVGHIERYNPATAVLMNILQQEHEAPLTLTAHRLAPFDGSRCMDVDVLLDLLIHDVDLALHIARAPVKTVSAVGRQVFSDRIDEAHTRIEFSNGTIATCWTARCSPRKVRTLAVTTKARYLEADLLNRTLLMCKANRLPSQEDGTCLMGEFFQEEVAIPYEEPLRRELNEFFQAVRERFTPSVDGESALAAMRVVALVAESIERGGEIRYAR